MKHVDFKSLLLLTALCIVLGLPVPAHSQSSYLVDTSWQSFYFEDARGIYSASSELDKPDDLSFGPYTPANLLDNDLHTAWVEGAKDNGVGQWVCLAMLRNIPGYIAIANGYQKSRELFLKNNRIKRLKVSLYVGFTDVSMVAQTGFMALARPYPGSFIITLEDKEGYQYFKLPFTRSDIEAFRRGLVSQYITQFYSKFAKSDMYNSLRDFYFVRFEILDVYPGTRWNDACISEIHYTNKPGLDFIPGNEQIVSIYENEQMDRVIVKSDKSKYILTDASQWAKRMNVTNEGSVVLSVLDISPDNQWVIVDVMIGGAGRRTEEYNVLYSVRLLRPISEDLLQTFNLVNPVGFTQRGKDVYVVFSKGETKASDIYDAVILHSVSDYFTGDARQALGIIFSKAIEKKDVQVILECVERSYFDHYMSSKNGKDTTNFVNNMLIGRDLATGERVSMPLHRIERVDKFYYEQYGGKDLLHVVLSDGKRQIDCRWKVVESSIPYFPGIYLVPG